MTDRHLKELARKLAEISGSLEYLAGSDDYLIESPSLGRGRVEGPRSTRALLKAAERAYNRRRWRDSLFGNPDLFGEPAWDILLDLYIAELRERRVSVTDACIGSGVPPTTALRWIMLLERADLVIRKKDPLDGRRAYLQLSKQGHLKMETYFERMLSDQG